MSDIQRIDLNRPIDNGGITFGKPPTSKEGRNSSRPITNLTSIASNLLNEYKPNNFDRETLSFSTLYSLMSDGTLGLYQSNLPYPGLSNYTLKSTIDISLNIDSEFTLYNHTLFLYNNNLYVAYGSNNIKVIDSNFNVSEINIGNKLDVIFRKNNNTLYSMVDTTLYEINLSTNTSSVYGTTDATQHPFIQGLYNTATDQFIFLSNNNTVSITDSNLVTQHSYEPTPLINSLRIYEDKLYIYMPFTRTSIDLNDFSSADLIASSTDNPEYQEILDIDLFGEFQIYNNPVSQAQLLYHNNALLGNIPSDYRVLMVDITSDIIILVNNFTHKRFAAVLSQLLQKNNIQTIVDLE